MMLNAGLPILFGGLDLSRVATIDKPPKRSGSGGRIELFSEKELFTVALSFTGDVLGAAQ
jgi:hypothetical protein